MVLTEMASIAKTRCPVKMDSYLTDGVRLVLTLEVLPGHTAVCVEDAMTGDNELLTFSAIEQDWRPVEREMRGTEDG